MSKFAKFALALTFILVIISLALNVYLIQQLLTVQRQARAATEELAPVLQESLRQTVTDLEALEQSRLEFNIDVQQDFPIQTEVPFDEIIEVPIQLSVPIKQNIETVITVNLVGVDVPLDIAVPVDVEVPIDYTVVVPIKRTIPISTTIPLDVSVPISIDISETELVGYITRLREGVTSLSDFVDQALARFE